MLGKRMLSIRKLAKKGKAVNPCDQEQQHDFLLGEYNHCPDEASSRCSRSSNTTRTGCFAVYVGEERRRFMVPTGYLSHPLFKMLLEKSCDEFGFQQKNGLVVPCSVSAFQEALNAMECCNGRFDFGNLVKEFI